MKKYKVKFVEEIDWELEITEDQLELIPDEEVREFFGITSGAVELDDKLYLFFETNKPHGADANCGSSLDIINIEEING